MFVFGGNNSGIRDDYKINNSLRTRRSANAYLSRTPASAGNRKTWTWSAWVKKAGMGVEQVLFNCQSGNAAALRSHVVFNTTDTLEFRHSTSGGVTTTQLITTQVFRDPSAWYHIMIVSDTTQATSSDRIKFYINGSQVTSFGTATYPSLNYDGGINQALRHRYASDNNGTTSFDGYTADMYFVDGTALTPSDFGYTHPKTGVWRPKPYTGSYGTNGFYLKFSDIATTSGSNAGLGKDFSGNSNYWDTTNISVTAGSTYDAMIDSPTLTSATVANYATFAGTNLGTYANATITEAGLKVSVSAGGTPDGGKAYAPFGMSDGSGKWYFEMTCVDPGATNQRLCFGIANVTTNPNAIAITNGYYASASGAHGNYNIGTFTTNDVLQVAYDSGTNKLWFGKNGTWYNSGNPAAGTTPLVTVTSGITYVPFSTYASSGGGPGIGAWNFGQRPFTYTPPTGFKALNTYNLPNVTIPKGNKVMDATTYTGNGSTQSITNASAFKPDFLWIKRRDAGASSHLQNSSTALVSGVYPYLSSNSTSGDQNDTPLGVTAINSNGFTVVDNSAGNGGVNGTSHTFVGWQWNANNGTTSSNTQGSITSTVQANTTAGFSIVTYTGTGANATVGHGLGVAPAMVIVKRRNSTGNWNVRHVSITAANSLYLNLTNASQSDPTVWNSTVPTSTVFSIGTDTGVNASGGTYVGYCWAEIAGFSKFGSYTGNGSTDGAFVYTGFRPAYLLIKRTSAIEDWFIFDSKRLGYNADNNYLYADLNNLEGTVDYIDILSNGFKARTTSTSVNSGTYIYAAFAENPFKYSLAR